MDAFIQRRPQVILPSVASLMDPGRAEVSYPPAVKIENDKQKPEVVFSGFAMAPEFNETGYGSWIEGKASSHGKGSLAVNPGQGRFHPRSMGHSPPPRSTTEDAPQYGGGDFISLHGNTPSSNSSSSYKMHTTRMANGLVAPAAAAPAAAAAASAAAAPAGSGGRRVSSSPDGRIYTPQGQHRGGRQRERTPPFRSDEERRHWQKERRKKDIHNKIEQRRRYNINDRIHDLGILLVGGGRDTLQSKGAILREAIQYIQGLRQERFRLRSLEAEAEEIERINSQLMIKVQKIEEVLQQQGFAPVSSCSASPRQWMLNDNQERCRFQTTAPPLHSPAAAAAAAKYPDIRKDPTGKYNEQTATNEQYDTCLERPYL